MNITPHEAHKLKYEIESLKEAIEFVQKCYKPDAVDENGKPYSPYFLLGYLEGASKRVVQKAQTVFADKNKKLVSYGGRGYEYSKEIGEFEVRAFNQEFLFKRLSEAISFYNQITEEKAIWDMTGIPDLLDAMFYEE